MNDLDQALSDAFDVIGYVAGTELYFEGSKFRCVASPVPRDHSEYSPAQSEQMMTMIEIRRENLPSDIVRGSEFIDYEQSKGHRVVEIIDHPQDVAVNFRCATFAI